MVLLVAIDSEDTMTIDSTKGPYLRNGEGHNL